MARTARKISGTMLYHVVLRGINKQTIFHDDEDRYVFLNRLKLVKKDVDFEIYAFCLMSNHVHLMIKEKSNRIGRIFMKALSSYVFWYNAKYERIGGLFQDRFKSEPIERESHLLWCLRYIHMNPVKAGMVTQAGDYEWSSHNLYVKPRESFINTEFLLGMLHGAEGYAELMEKSAPEHFIDFDNVPRISDSSLRGIIQTVFKDFGIESIEGLERKEFREIMTQIHKTSGASIRRIAEILRIPAHIVRSAIK